MKEPSFFLLTNKSGYIYVSGQGPVLNIDCDLMQEPYFFWKQIWFHFHLEMCLARPRIDYWLRFDERAILFLKTNLVLFLSIDVSEQAGLWIENWLRFDARTLIILVTTNIFILIIFVSGQGLYWILIAIWWHLICLLLPRTTPSYMWQRGERQCDIFYFLKI